MEEQWGQLQTPTRRAATVRGVLVALDTKGSLCGHTNRPPPLTKTPGSLGEVPPDRHRPHKSSNAAAAG